MARILKKDVCVMKCLLQASDYGIVTLASSKTTLTEFFLSLLLETKNRYPTRVLLEENGIEATGDLSTFPAIGDPRAVATLLILRREKDTQKQGTKVLDDVVVSEDGKELTFRLKTEIGVQKPELLLEQYGVSQLFRITIGKATLNSNDGNIMAVFASALEKDFANGIDGPALEETVSSFVATRQVV